ncbi:PREDICTED: dynein intermediate chain 1, axonemal-like [Bactrocera latifrons]|uniref:dynein intermediate chain 1, axonemal-like n=1 Tax=Bactrocera latifrons TaxID=174628 RepID=UPI0008DE4F7A|nr:PREDICTED: dynein intermediate chain 1, axonemal-like [Bactrocera latifrons]
MENGKEQNTRRGTRLIRTSTSTNFDYNVSIILDEWRQLKYIRNLNEAKEWMPKEMPQTAKYRKLVEGLYAKVNKEIHRMKGKQSFISEHLSMMSSMRGTRAMGGLKLTISDIMEGVPSMTMVFRENELTGTLSNVLPMSSTIYRYNGYIQIVLRPTDSVMLYEHNSETVRKGTPESAEVIDDNLVYDYLTMGEGRLRGRRDSEAQTRSVLLVNAAAATGPIYQRDSNDFTSRYDIYETMHAHKQPKKHSGLIKCPSKAAETCLNALAHNISFTRAVMRVERGISINSHIRGQMHYRNLLKQTGLHEKGTYNIQEIFRFTKPPFENLNQPIKARKAVSDISFCFGNADLVAIAYGVYSYAVQIPATTGNVCVWSIKNVLHPERTYSYNSPVTAVSFSPFDHSLIAVGMANGWLEVRDISVENNPPLSIINRSTITGNDPVMTIKWYLKPVFPSQGFKRFITLSRTAVVRKYRFHNGPHVFTTELTRLSRVRGEVEGLSLHGDAPELDNRSDSTLFCFNLTLDPLNKDLYYMLTDQGCIHNGSMTLEHSFSSPLRTHIYGSVNCMEFSPWSPKIYLTCGNDWFVRIWMLGVTEPLLELTHKMFPVHYAAWSPTQSTTIFSLTRKTLDIWDIRNPFRPIKSVNVASSHNTLFKPSPTGTAVMIGNEHGDVIVCGVGETFILPKFQYDTMEEAIYAGIQSESLRQLVKEAGFFGYENKSNRRMFPAVYARI